MNEPLRVLLACPWDDPFGGVVSVVGNLAHHLTDHGHRVVMLHPGERDTLEPRTTEWGFPGYRLRLRPPRANEHPLRSTAAFALTAPRTLQQLVQLWRRERFDIVNLHYPGDTFAAPAMLRSILPVKLVTSVHGSDLFPQGHRRPRYDLGQRALLANSDLVVAPSASFREDCVALFPWLGRRTTVILNGVDLTRLATPTRVPPGRYVLCIAVPQPKKGLDVLLRAWARLGDADCRLELVGHGPQQAELERLAVELGFGERVRIRGALPDAETVGLLHGCEALVLPSLYEPFGLAVAEAMACGKPVVASAVGGLREIVQPGRTGLLVTPGDEAELAGALRRLLDDAGLRSAMGEAGRVRAYEYFGHERMGAGYEAAFRELLA